MVGRDRDGIKYVVPDYKNTRELIYKNQLELFRYYLGPIVEKPRFRSPLRNDKNPGCFLEVYNGIVYFVDFGDMETHRDIIRFVMAAKGLTMYEAIRDILDVIHSDNFKSESGQISFIQVAIEHKKVENKDTNYSLSITAKKGASEIFKEYFGFFGIDVEEHNKLIAENRANFYIVDVDHYEIGKTEIVPRFAIGYIYVDIESGEVIGEKLYQPFSKTKKWLSRINKEVIGWILDKDSEIMVIASSAKDSCTLFQNKGNIKLDVYHGQSETSIPEDKIINIIREKNYKNVIVIFDNDKTGIERSEVLAKKIKKNVDVDVAVVLPDDKDIADEFNNRKNLDRLMRKIEIAVSNFDTSTPTEMR